ncbi:AMP-binding protein [Streptomyces sp. JNUCC 64]
MTAPDPAVNYAEPILDALAADPGRTALIAADGHPVTAGELRATAHRLARHLTALGLGPGTTAGLLVGNTPEAVAARYAVALTGARAVVLYGGTPPAVLARVAADAHCALLLTDTTQHPVALALAARDDAPALLGLGPNPLGDDVLAASAALPSGPYAVRVPPETDWCLAYTSGTTGPPKGVRMSHANRLAAFRTVPRDPAGPPRQLVCTPYAYATGALTDLTLLHDGTVVLRPGFDPGDALRSIARERVTRLWLTPPLLWRLLDHPGLPATDLSSLTQLAYGGCPAPAARLRRAVEVFGPVLYGYYGQTEAGAVSVLPPGEHVPDGPDGAYSAGRPLPGVEVALLDPDGRPVPPGATGEVHVRTPTLMTGYWNRPELTAEAFRDGWLRTGDLGRLDGRGHLHVVDRIKDLIIVGGGELLAHVHPSALEDLLLGHPAISQCAVFGVPGPDRSETVHAAAVPAPGHRLDPDGIRAFVTDRAGASWAPTALHRLTSLPLTAQGKPDRVALRAAYAPGGGRSAPAG